MTREGLAVGLFFIVAGMLFLLDALDVVTVRPGYLWPLLLIGFGIALIAGARRRPEPEPEKEPEPEPEKEGEPAPQEEGRPAPQEESEPERAKPQEPRDEPGEADEPGS